MMPQPNNQVTAGVRARGRRQRRSPDSGATRAAKSAGRRGPLGFRYREAMRIVRPVSEIEDDDRSLDQRERCDEGKGAAHE